jgi:hypothetical protein
MEHKRRNKKAAENATLFVLRARALLVAFLLRGCLFTISLDVSVLF